ncbi:MAG: efflux RND transporter periplasmic adaptor subunit [Gemmatimonadaceae bacterium]|nr:efflux RND transporter periplasmic adaptor subunit [Chitinophagaceae bacterium]
MRIQQLTIKKVLRPFIQLSTQLGVFTLIISFIGMYGCNSLSGNSLAAGAPPPPALPVLKLGTSAATTYQEFSASLQGSRDIEIRPQVEGYLEKIYVDEGAYVKKGQSLFAINDRPFREQVNNARAALSAAEANLSNADINVSKLTPLVQNNVISDVQLKTSKATQAAATAAVVQARSILQSASINLGYTIITAPVDGYVGRIPYKAGSIVGTNVTDPLTVVSAVKEVYAYFSMSEKDFLQFESQYSGTTVQEKIKQMPEVELMLADNSTYPYKGKIEIVSGQFNDNVGTISFRASFPNTAGLLRSGNTGKIRIPHAFNTAILVPQEATFELQDKVFVFLLSDSNKVASTPITVAGTTGHYYLVEKGLQPGQQIVYTGLDRLRDGAFITPEPMSLDSLIKKNPL